MTDIKRVFKLILKMLAGWTIFVPLAFLVPKKNIIYLIPRFKNTFEGNLKYLFLYLHGITQSDYKFFFLTEDKKLHDEMITQGLPSFLFDGIRGTFRLLRAKAVVVDSNEWTGHCRYHALYRAFKIQLWHGNGMKTVGTLKPHVRKRGYIIKLAAEMLGHHPHYNILVMNSQMQADIRADGFRYDRLLINGQPRNDIFFITNYKEFNIGVDKKIIELCRGLRAKGKKIIVYTPTWRKEKAETGRLKQALDISRLDRFSAHNNLIVILKLHPKSKFVFNTGNAGNVFEYQREMDIYPLLPETDLMITDYSSIFIDYLLLNRPVIFFPFDYEHYVSRERALQFNYEDITPGKKCFSQGEIEDELLQIVVNGQDGYEKQRREIAGKFFEYKDGRSSERIWREIKNID